MRNLFLKQKIMANPKLCYNSLVKNHILSNQKEQLEKNSSCSKYDSSQLYQLAEL